MYLLIKKNIQYQLNFKTLDFNYGLNQNISINLNSFLYIYMSIIYRQHIMNIEVFTIRNSFSFPLLFSISMRYKFIDYIYMHTQNLRLIKKNYIVWLNDPKISTRLWMVSVHLKIDINLINNKANLIACIV